MIGLGMMVGPLAKLAGELVDNLFETEEEKAAARAKLMRLDRDGRLKAMEQHLSAILAEAKSDDPWTSRARPSFLYVVYLYILAAIPFGVLFYIDPVAADSVTVGMQAWLAAIPEEMWWLFGSGYLGYTGARSFDKRRKAGGE